MGITWDVTTMYVPVCLCTLHVLTSILIGHFVCGVNNKVAIRDGQSLYIPIHRAMNPFKVIA